MGNINVNQFSYNFTSGKVTSAQVGFTNDGTEAGQYLNATVQIHQSDLPEGKDFMSVSMDDLTKIARQLLANDTAVKEDTTATK